VSDAAPLPRLGEVFFDVRGNSRSMRLSWYADTGVAVFSIWQAGMCTGTFRLPIADLSRMIEILERGPSPEGRGRAPVSAGRRGPERGRDEYPADQDEIGLLDSPDGPGRQGGYAGMDYAADYGRSGHGPDADSGAADYPAADYGSAGYGDDGYDDKGYGHAGYADASQGGSGYGYGGAGRHGDDHGTAGYQPADYGAGRPDGSERVAYEYESAGYGRAGYAEDDPGRRGAHRGADYSPSGADYVPGGYSAGAPDYLTGEHTAAGHDGMRADNGSDYLSGYGSQPAFPAGGRRRDDSRFPPESGSLPTAETDGTGYHEERFVPPYVQGGGESYLNDNRGGVAGYEADPDFAGYPADAPALSPSDGYHEARRSGEAYSYGAEYRRR
jgi:hypothetical protein